MARSGDYTITTDYHKKERKKSVDFEIKCLQLIGIFHSDERLRKSKRKV